MILIKRGFFVILSISLFLICSEKVLADVSAPTNLATNITNFNTINLTWTAVDGAAGYKVYQNNALLSSVSSPAYTYGRVTFPGNQYCFTVVTTDASGASSVPSSEVCASIVQGTAIPATGLTATALSTNSVGLTWQYPLSQETLDASDPIDGYSVLFFIERSVDNGATWAYVTQLSKAYFPGDSLEMTYTDTGAKPASTNMYRVTTLHQSHDGFSQPSQTATVNLGQVEAVPSAPTQLAMDYSISSVANEGMLVWNDTSADETGFVVEKQSGDTWVEFKRVDYSNSSSVHVYDLSPGVIVLRVRAKNAAGLSAPSNTLEVTTASSLNWTSPIASQHLLVIYNADDPRSVDMKNYYMANRPGISDANVFGVHFPAIGLDPKGFIIQYVDKSLFQDSILKPITQWLLDHSDKPIRYIALMYGMPSIVSGCTTVDYERCHSAQYQIGRSLQIAGVRDGAEYRGGRTTRYTPEYYRGTTALVTTLDMGSVAATKGYIDKLKKVYEKMANKDVVISAKNAGLGGTTYYFEDKGDSLNIGEIARDAVLSVNPSARVMYKPRGYFTTASDVLGYSTHGTWGGLAKNFPTNSSVIFSGNSGWYLLRTGESWNGIYNNVNSGQSNPSEWFAQTAFGSTNYENTPVGAVGQVVEPGGAGLASKELFTAWEKGYLFAEAAWSSRNIKGFLAVGDPLVANTGPVPVAADASPADTVPPVIQDGAPSGTLPADTTSKLLSVTTNENATCKYSTAANAAFGASTRTVFTTTGAKTHSVTLNNLTADRSYSYYVRCQDTAGNANSSDYIILFAIAATVPQPDTTAPTVFVSFPASQSTVYEGSVTLAASASDLVGISGVKFYVDGQLAGSEDLSAPYSLTTTLTAGTHRVYASARDTAGNQSSSPTITFTVRTRDLDATVPPAITPPPANPPALTPVQTEYIRLTYVPTTDNVERNIPTSFSKQLKLDDNDPEVALLQKTLNLLGYVIADSGPGSAGNETSKFGEQTREALIKYQRSYAESGILATGALDNATIALLNKDIDRLVAQTDIQESAPASDSGADGGEGFIARVGSFIGSVLGGIADFIVGIFR